MGVGFWGKSKKIVENTEGPLCPQTLDYQTDNQAFVR
jgi:hypothetical protein